MVDIKDKKRITTGYLISIAVVCLVVFFGLIAMIRLIRDGLVPLTAIVGAVVIFVSLVYLRKKFSAYKWMAIGIVLVLLFSIYPIVYTVLLSFTNMRGGHLITRQQAIQRISDKQYQEEDALTYSWTAYLKGKNEYALWLQSESGESILAYEGREPEIYTEEPADLGKLDSGGIPEELPGGYKKLTRKDVVPIISQLGEIIFGKAPFTVQVISLREATSLKARYIYDEDSDSFTDAETGKIYAAEDGTFTADDGEELSPGFIINVGTDNYSRFISNPGYRNPIFSILIWNIAFTFFSVIISFLVGLMIAIVFERLPGKRIIRALLIVPYPIPVLVSIVVWKGLLNENKGLITGIIQNIFGAAPKFFTDAAWTRIALILINVYLSYPYFYILCAGALQSIPNEIFQAADIDGAGAFRKLRYITMPMVLRILAPLVIASLSFNFNNFTLVWGFNAGLPAMADSIVPMGKTDLLISFVYRLGFSTANASDYSFASAITVILFIFVAIMVFFQTRSTKAFKEVD